MSIEQLIQLKAHAIRVEELGNTIACGGFFVASFVIALIGLIVYIRSKKKQYVEEASYIVPMFIRSLLMLISFIPLMSSAWNYVTADSIAMGKMAEYKLVELKVGK